MAFDGLRVLALESRRAAGMAELIRRQGSELAPSMREIPLEARRGDSAIRASQLVAGEFDMMILLTGVGTRILNQALATRYPPERFAEALRRITVVPRGPKPVAALREMGITPAVVAPEPNTWRELLQAIEGRTAKQIAVQEYGPRSERRNCWSTGLRERRRRSHIRARVSVGLARRSRAFI